MKKSLPIGTDDFKKLIDENYYYIDKTLLIKELIDYGGEVTLITRPRRFGKTLNLSMLKYFFERSGENNAYLFKDKKIWNEISERKNIPIQNLQGQFPVIFLTFKGLKATNWEDLFFKFKNLISDFFDQNYKTLKDVLTDAEKKKYQNVIDKVAHQGDYENSFKFLTELFYKKFNKKTYFFLDEYDTPIHAAYDNKYYDKCIEFIKGLLGNVLKTNFHLEYGCVTGALHLAQAGIFTELNNFNVFTITNEHVYDKFGFTHNEVKQLVKDLEINTKFEDLKKWFDGYRIGYVEEEKSIYNPWSIIKCANNKGKLETYWVNTSDQLLIKKILAKANMATKMSLEDLLTKEEIKKEVNERLILPGIENNESALWTLFLATGYLTYTHIEQQETVKIFSLTFPNLEIKGLYKEFVKSIFIEALPGKIIGNLNSVLKEGNIANLTDILQGFVRKSVSFHDIPEEEAEISYHNFILGILVGLSDVYFVKSNRESGYGRYDIMLIPKKMGERAFIFEFKKVIGKETLENAAKNAIDQIIKQDYASELRELGFTDIFCYGVAFQRKEVFVEIKKN